MKITINGSLKEVSELFETLRDGAKDAAKKADLPPLLTELAEDEKINELAEAIRNADKENAPQVEAAEQDSNQGFFEKQMELLSQASKDCLSDTSLYQCLAPLTQAMILIEFLRA